MRINGLDSGQWRFGGDRSGLRAGKRTNEVGVLGKTHIGELFFKERTLKLPSPLPQRFQFSISEKSLRLLITVLTVLFLMSLGASLFIQLMQSRIDHLFEQNRITALDADVVALGVPQPFQQAEREGMTPPHGQRRFPRGPCCRRAPCWKSGPSSWPMPPGQAVAQQSSAPGVAIKNGRRLTPREHARSTTSRSRTPPRWCDCAPARRPMLPSRISTCFPARLWRSNSSPTFWRNGRPASPGCRRCSP